MATKKTKSAPKKKTVKAKAKGKVTKKSQSKKPRVPYITTKEGMDALRYYCEGIMDLVGEYIVIANPKISQAQFAKEAHSMIQGFFGITAPKAEKRARR